jgi:hypothetical protein
MKKKNRERAYSYVLKLDASIAAKITRSFKGVYSEEHVATYKQECLHSNAKSQGELGVLSTLVRGTDQRSVQLASPKHHSSTTLTSQSLSEAFLQNITRHPLHARRSSCSID